MNGGGGRIRTHGTLRHNSFQDCRLQPLGHSSKTKFFGYLRIPQIHQETYYF